MESAAAPNTNEGDTNSDDMDGAGRPVDIAPAGGTLVLFNSRTLLHQV
jgi:hypothetical protein